MSKSELHTILSSVQMSSRDKKNLINVIANSGGKDVYIIDLDKFKTAEDFNNLKNAANLNKVIICQGNIIILSELPNGDLLGQGSVIMSGIESNSDIKIFASLFAFTADGQAARFNNSIVLNSTGDGTKFLSDDGTYHDININTISGLSARLQSIENRIKALEDAANA